MKTYSNNNKLRKAFFNTGDNHMSFKAKIFHMDKCDNCSPALKIINDWKKGLDPHLWAVEMYDASTRDGMTEMAFYDIDETPSLVAIGLEDKPQRIIGKFSVRKLKEVQRKIEEQIPF